MWVSVWLKHGAGERKDKAYGRAEVDRPEAAGAGVVLDGPLGHLEHDGHPRFWKSRLKSKDMLPVSFPE